MCNRIINVSAKENIWACALYVASLVFVFPGSNIILPLSIWLWKKEESDFVKEHGKNVLNFQLSLVCFMMVAAVIFISIWSAVAQDLSDLFAVFFILNLGFFLFLLIVDLNFMLIAAVRAYKRKKYSINYSYKFIK